MSRLLRFDSLKGMLITLVVIGHMIEFMMLDSGIGRYVYTAIYTFHMPLFVILSGYFFNRDCSGKKILKSIVTLTETLVVFQAIRILITSRGGEVWSMKDIITPHWVLWYICSLILWRTATFLIFRTFRNLRLRHLILVAIGLSLLAGLVPLKNELAFQRTFYFYPFFIFGMALRNNMALIDRKPAKSIIGGSILLIICTIAAFAILDILHFDSFRFGLYGNRPYQEFSDVIRKYGCMTIGFVLSVIALRFLPANMIFARIGMHSMPIYLLHTYFIDIINRWLIETDILPANIGSVTIYSLAVIAIIYLTCSHSTFKYLSNPLSNTLQKLNSSRT